MYSFIELALRCPTLWFSNGFLFMGVMHLLLSWANYGTKWVDVQAIS